MQNVFRFSLYSDEVLVVDPFDLPWYRRAEYNPIRNPEPFIQSTLKKVMYVLLLKPWIEHGLVTLLPDPTELDPTLRRLTMALGRKRMEECPLTQEDFELFEPLATKDTLRTILTLEPEHLKQFFRNAGAPEADIDTLVKTAKTMLKDDPLGVEAPLDDEKGQLLEITMGAVFESGLLMAVSTGAFPYTDVPNTWTSLKAHMDVLPDSARIWTPLTQAFARLDFKFLNSVNSRFACSLREDGRLENIRSFLRRLWGTLNDEYDAPVDESLAKAFADEVVEEHKRVEEEWRDIDARVATESTLSVLAGLDSVAQGHLIPALCGILGGPAVSLLSANRTRKSFRGRIPLSIFIDLKSQKAEHIA